MTIERRVSMLLLPCAMLLAGCAGASRVPAVPGTGGGAAEDPLLVPLAKILRAEDRREVDANLRSALEDPRREIRARAVRAVGRIGSPDAGALLAGTVRDPESSVRRETARALGRVAGQGSVSALDALARDPDPGVRADAAEALGRVRDPGAAGILASLLSDADARVRAAAALAVGSVPDPSFALDRLIELSRSAEPGFAFCGAYALARLGAQGADAAPRGVAASGLSTGDVRRVRDQLVLLASSRVPEIRVQAAQGLSSPSPGPETRILGALSQDPEIVVQIAAVRSLGYPNAPIDPFLRRALLSKSAALRQVAVEALGAVATPLALEILVQTLAGEDRIWIRQTAIHAIGRADPTLAAGLANGLSKEPDPQLRAAAARNLTGWGDPRSVEIAGRLLSDPDARVRAAAALSRAGTTGALADVLGTALSDADPLVRRAVATVAGLRLARTGATAVDRDEAMGALETLWNTAAGDPSPSARLEIVEALARARENSRARVLLDLALSDPDRSVRARAASVLRSTFGEDAASRVGPASDLPLEHYVEVLRWGIAPRFAIVTIERDGFPPGRFTVSLDPERAPLASWNFSRLADSGFYDGLTVHRVVPGASVQDGDPRGDGTGGPGFTIRDELGGRSFLAGTLGMASEGPDSAGSQWFLTLSAQPHLDGRYTAFGKVEQNFPGVVAQIEPGDRVVSIRTFEGTGQEPLPPLRP